MLGEGERKFIDGNSAAVVNDADERSPAVLQFDGDVGRSGVDGVFNDLLDDGSRPFDDFAGGDAIDQGGGKPMNWASNHEAIILEQAPWSILKDDKAF